MTPPAAKSRKDGSTAILDWSEAALKGEHNLDNCLAATAACLCLGLSPEEVAAGLTSFPGVPHRLQEVGVVDGVTYVNDSKATNVDAAHQGADRLPARHPPDPGRPLQGLRF